MSDRRRSPAIPRSPVAAARTAHGANRAADALLLQAPPDIGGFWCAWAQIVLTAVLETVAAELTGGGRRRRHSELDVLDQRTDSLLTDGTSAPTTVVKLDSSERSPAVRALIHDAAERFTQFHRGVVEDLGRGCVDRVLATVRWGVDQAVHPPPGVTPSEWFRARWRALDTPCPQQADLWGLVAAERVGAHHKSQAACSTRSPPT